MTYQILLLLSRKCSELLDSHILQYTIECYPSPKGKFISQCMNIKYNILADYRNWTNILHVHAPELQKSEDLICKCQSLTYVQMTRRHVRQPLMKTYTTCILNTDTATGFD